MSKQRKKAPKVPREELERLHANNYATYYRRQVARHCPTPQKKAYSSEYRADIALMATWKAARGKAVPSGYYRCKCKKWHLKEVGE